MRNEPLLTRDELAFLQQLLDEPAPSAAASQADPLVVDSSPAVRALLASLGDQAHFTVEALVNGQRLSFPLRLSRDHLQALQVRLDAPQIFEKGIVERPWRATLAKPFPLLQRSGAASGLSIIQLSQNGALVSAESGTLPNGFTLWMALPDKSTLSLRGKQVRAVNASTAAYRITPLQSNGFARLQELLAQLRTAAQGA